MFWLYKPKHIIVSKMPRLKTPLGLSFCFFVFVIHGTIGQTTDSTTRQIEHAPMIDTRANEPVRILSMRLPFRIAPIAGKHEISLDLHSGNTWNPSGVLEYQEPWEPYPAKPWEATYHPHYDEAPDRYQFYSADGVMRSCATTYTRKVSPSGELYTAINVNMLVGGESFIDAAARDNTIEHLHRILLGQDDPFRRFEHGLNLAEMKFTDRQGRTFEIRPRQLFAGTWDVGYRHFTELLQRQKILWTLSLEAQAGIPLTRGRDHMSAGLIAGTALTKQVTKNYGMTIAVGYAAQHDKVARIREEYLDLNYADIVTGYRILLGQNIDFKNHHRFSIGIEMQGMTAPLSTKQRVTAPHVVPEDVGVQSSYAPERWTYERPINVTNQRRAARSLIRGSEFLSMNFTYRFGGSDHAPSVTLYLQEDWTVLYDTEGEFLPLFLLSNNAQDFGVGVRLSKVIR